MLFEMLLNEMLDVAIEAHREFSFYYTNRKTLVGVPWCSSLDTVPHSSEGTMWRRETTLHVTQVLECTFWLTVAAATHWRHRLLAPALHWDLLNWSFCFSTLQEAQILLSRARFCSCGFTGLHSKHSPLPLAQAPAEKPARSFATPQAAQTLLVCALAGKCWAKACWMSPWTSLRVKSGSGLAGSGLTGSALSEAALPEEEEEGLSATLLATIDRDLTWSQAFLQVSCS